MRISLFRWAVIGVGWFWFSVAGVAWTLTLGPMPSEAIALTILMTAPLTVGLSILILVLAFFHKAQDSWATRKLSKVV